MGAMSRPYAELPTELPAMRFPTDYRVPEAERPTTASQARAGLNAKHGVGLAVLQSDESEVRFIHVQIAALFCGHGQCRVLRRPPTRASLKSHFSPDHHF